MRPNESQLSSATRADVLPSSYSSAVLQRFAGSKELSAYTVCHDEQIPPYVEEALDRLYGHVFSSLAYYRLHSGLAGVSTYVRWSGGRNREDIDEVFLFRRERGEISVLNEGIRITDDAVNTFASTVFERYPDTDVLHFHAVDSTLQQPHYPGQIYNCTDDTMIALPGTTEAYLESLGKTTRKNIRRYQRRLEEDFPDYVYRVDTAKHIDRDVLCDIIGLNRTRMLNKNKRPGIDEVEAERLWQLAQTHGVLGTATIAGKVCAGAIAFRFGDHIYSFVRAHDPAFDHYRLGLVGGAAFISECIRRGAKEFHFLLGREAHKLLLGGERKELHHITLYRSHRHMLRRADVMLRNMRLAQERKTRLWLHAQRERDTWLWRTGRSLAHVVRRAA